MIMQGNYTVLYGEIIDIARLENTSDNIVSRLSSVINSSLEKYNGKVIGQPKESVKIVFKNPVNAVQCALYFFRKLSIEPRIPFRISINNGFVDFTGDEIYGETAFITDQILQICSEGAVLVTEEIRNLVSTNNNIAFKYIGSTLLKGLNSPTEIYCVAQDNLYIPAQIELSGKSRNKNSIAVLPFHNTSSEKELDYICEGLAEEIIDSLTKERELFVTARFSSFMFRNRDMSILEISRKLNVSFILDGSIRKRNNVYRISYQLVDCASGYNLISDMIESGFDRLYDSENKISKSVVQYFLGNESEPVEAQEDFYIDPTAYSYYLKGKFLSTHWSIESVQKAIQYFNKALEIVPDYALAYAGLSITYTHMALNGYHNFKDSLQLALQNAEKSIESDKSIPDGYMSKAIATFWMGNWYIPDFEKNLTAALATSPCNAEIRMFNGMLFLFKGELRRALSELILASQLDPYSQGVNIRLGLVQYLNREYEDAFNTFLALSRNDNNKTYNILRLVWCCIMLKQYHKALEYLVETDRKYEFFGMVYSCYLIIYKELKDENNFYKYKTIIEDIPKEDPNYYYNMAVLNKLLGKTEESIKCIEKLLLNPIFLFMFPQYDEFWYEYHEHPLFVKLVTSKYSSNDNNLIRIDSETKEFIEVKIGDFFYAEAQDNYTLIVSIENSKVTERVLRATLSNVEDQLENIDIFRCHRSYLVNLSQGFVFRKIDQKAFLKHIEYNISIPVARAKEKEMKMMLANKKI